MSVPMKKRSWWSTLRYLVRHGTWKRGEALGSWPWIVPVTMITRAEAEAMYPPIDPLPILSQWPLVEPCARDPLPQDDAT